MSKNKNKPRFVPGMKRKLPDNACRVIHPELGVMVWKINGLHYRSRNAFLHPPTMKGAGGHIVVDTSIEAELSQRKAQAEAEQVA